MINAILLLMRIPSIRSTFSAGMWQRSTGRGQRCQVRAQVTNLAADVDVVETYDVAVAEVAADLHLDQLERNLAGIGEPMNAADRDIDRLVFVHDAHVAAERDLGRSFHHHPMLRSMKMLLQREHAAR